MLCFPGNILVLGQILTLSIYIEEIMSIPFAYLVGTDWAF